MNALKTIGIVILTSVVLLAGSALVATHNAPKDADGHAIVGALSGPDISSPYLKWGDVIQYNAKLSMKTATTTLCAIQNPSTGTSTILSATLQVNTGTSTAAAISFATSTNQYATTTAGTLVADYPVASGARATISYDAASNANIIGPGQYLLFKTSGAGLGGYTYDGVCQARFEAL